MKRLAALLLVMFLITGCSGNGINKFFSRLQDEQQAKHVLQGYMELLAGGHAETAYNDLTSATQKKVSRQDFVTFHKLRKNFVPKSKSTFKVEEYLKKVSMPDASYPEGFYFTESVTYTNAGSQKAPVDHYRYLVVNENDHWKVYLLTADKYKEGIAQMLKSTPNFNLPQKGK
ncbi:MAG TPA: hypothetical protein VNU93_04795 [Verrucomicrobiae bacterium]|nr:hypothetical protein [Verrucomicrobiae bacterium]